MMGCIEFTEEKVMKLSVKDIFDSLFNIYVVWYLYKNKNIIMKEEEIMKIIYLLLYFI